MNDQVTIIDSQNQSLNVNKICYFVNNKNNKKYLFYDKGEIVQDGLIKMYVAVENNGVITEISQDEWTDLKLIMQDIIKGTKDNSNIEFNSISDSFNSGGEKVIALSQTNIDSIKKSYNSAPKVVAPQNNVSNKDLLSQSFGGNPNVSSVMFEPVDAQSNLEPVTNNVVVPEIPAVSEPQFKVPLGSSGTPDLESTAVNMGMSSGINDFNLNIPIIPETEKKVETEISVDTDKTDDNMFGLPTMNIPTENVLPDVSSQDASNQELDVNPFKVSDAPNIFDIPMDTNNNAGEVKSDTLEDSSNLFNGVNSVPSVNELKQSEEQLSIPNNVEDDISLDESILEARIAIENDNYYLYMKLAENSKRMAELLAKQIKSKKESNLENTASNLFNSSGVLDDNVLGDNVLGFGR